VYGGRDCLVSSDPFLCTQLCLRFTEGCIGPLGMNWTGTKCNLQGQEDDTTAEFSVLRRVNLSSIPRREILNKENLLEPGPWNGKPHNNRKVAVLSRPQQPSFECEASFSIFVEINYPVKPIRHFWKNSKFWPIRWVNMLKGKPEKDTEKDTDMAYSRILYYINSAVNCAFFTVKPHFIYYL